MTEISVRFESHFRRSITLSGRASEASAGSGGALAIGMSGCLWRTRTPAFGQTQLLTQVGYLSAQRSRHICHRNSRTNRIPALAGLAGKRAWLAINLMTTVERLAKCFAAWVDVTEAVCCQVQFRAGRSKLRRLDRHVANVGVQDRRSSKSITERENAMVRSVINGLIKALSLRGFPDLEIATTVDNFGSADSPNLPQRLIGRIDIRILSYGRVNYCGKASQYLKPCLNQERCQQWPWRVDSRRVAAFSLVEKCSY